MKSDLRLLPKALFQGLFFFSLLQSAVSADGLSSLEVAQSTPLCKNKIRKVEALKRIVQMKEYQDSQAQKEPKLFQMALGQWSPESLLTSHVEINQKFLAACDASAQVQAILTGIETAYLSHLLLGVSKSPQKTQKLFQSLLVMPKDFSRLKSQLSQMIATQSQSEVLSQLDSTHAWIREVMVVGAKLSERQKLEGVIGKLCGQRLECPFWSSHYLYKVILTSEKKVATYLPKMGILLLSRDLLLGTSQLHDLVVAHELSHVAIHRSYVLHERDWVKQFSVFSGWEYPKPTPSTASRRLVAQVVVQKEARRPDTLQKESIQSDFGLLPDKLVLGKTGYDGFVFHKGYLQSIEQNNVAEDLADHMAAYALFPQRYCEGKIAIAPQKYAWISAHVFGNARKLNCHKKKT